MDQVYKDAISIYLFKPTSFATLHKAWSWAGRRPDTAFGMSIFEFRQTGWTPLAAIIPGYPLGILIGITVISIVGLTITRKREEGRSLVKNHFSV